MSEQRQDEKVGALWAKSSARGEFFTGTIELTPAQVAELQANGGKLPVVVFRNEKKTGNQPDWRMLKSKPREAAPVVPLTDQDVPF